MKARRLFPSATLVFFTLVALNLVCCKSTSSSADCQTDNDCPNPKVCINNRCVGGSDPQDGGDDGNEEVREVQVDDGTVVVNASWGSGPGELGHTKGSPRGPMSFTVASDGRIYVLDQVNRRIQVFDSGSFQKSIPLPPTYYFNDMALTAGGRIVLLDNIKQGKVVFLNPSGEVDHEIELKGPGIPLANDVVKIYAHEAAIWGFTGKKSIRIADDQGNPGDERPSVSGVFSRDGRLLLAAKKDGDTRAVVHYEPVSGSVDQAGSWDVDFDWDIHGVEALNSDAQGRVYVGVKWMLRDAMPPHHITESFVEMVVLDRNGQESRRVLMGPCSKREQYNRCFHSTDDGAIYQLRFDDAACTVRRYGS